MGCFGSKGSKGNAFKPGSFKQIQAKYTINPEVLGTGNFGKVFLAQWTANPNIKVAIKALSKAKIENQIDLIREEIKILSKLDHPNIIRYYETYESDKYMYLVMEYCNGGELFEKLTRNGDSTFSEKDAAAIMRKLFLAINHCHSNNIAHRDIKPENIMYSTNGDTQEIKLIDFGLSKQAKNSKQNLGTVVGTPYYVAPEVLEGVYGMECDLWSLGVVLYILLSGYLPFSANNHIEVFEKVRRANYTFKQNEWKSVSDEAKDLITKLLCKDIKKRLTASKALEHPWFKSTEKFAELKLDPHVMNTLKEYKGISKLKKEALNVLVKAMNESEIEHLRH